MFSFILPQEAVSGVEAEALAIAAQRAAEGGELWLTRCHVDELTAKLRSIGFSRIIHLTPEEALRRYLGNRRDGLREKRGDKNTRRHPPSSTAFSVSVGRMQHNDASHHGKPEMAPCYCGILHLSLPRPARVGRRRHGQAFPCAA